MVINCAIFDQLALVFNTIVTHGNESEGGKTSDSIDKSGQIEIRILREELTMLKSFTYFGAKGVLAAVAMAIMPASHAAVASMQSEFVTEKAQCSAKVDSKSAQCTSEVSQPLLAIKKICTISPEGNICLPKKAPKRSKTSPEKRPKPQMA